MLMHQQQEVRRQLQRHFYWKKYGISTAIICIPLLGLGIFGLIIALLLAWPIAKVWAGSLADKALARMLRIENAVKDRLLGTPAAARYFTADATNDPCGIAVDPAAETLTTVTWVGPYTKQRLETLEDDCFQTQVFKSAEILEWKAFQPGVSLHELVGSIAHQRTEDIMAVNRQNASARREQRDGTGLFIGTDRLNAQEVFLNMNYPDAQKWILLLKKFSDRTLPAVTEPTPFPQPQA